MSPSISKRFDAALRRVPDYDFYSISATNDAPNPLLAIKTSSSSERGSLISIPCSGIGASMLSAGTGAICRNPGWHQWVQDMAKASTTQLGVQGELEVQLRTVLYNGESLPFDDTEHSGSFGSFAVVPPSLGPYTITVQHSVANERLIMQADETYSYESTTMALWFGTDPPVIEANTGEAPLVIVYSLSTPSIPADPFAVASGEGPAEILSDWISSMSRAEDDAPDYLCWLLSRHCDSFEKMSEGDKRRWGLLDAAAKRVRMKLYIVCEVVFTIKQPQEDHGKHGTLDWARIETMDTASKKLHRYSADIAFRKWWDCNANAAMTEKVRFTVNFDKPAAHLSLAPGWGADLGPAHQESYDGGVYTQSHLLSAIVLWPEARHLETVSSLFDWNSAGFLDPALWKEDDSAEVWQFFEQLIEALPGTQENMGDTRNQFLTVAAGARRLDVCLTIVEKMRYHSGVAVLEMLIDRCSNDDADEQASITGILNASIDYAEDLKTVLDVFCLLLKVSSVEIAELMLESILHSEAHAEPFATQLTVEDLLCFEAKLGALFQSQVLPRVKNYSDTAYWVELLKRLKATDVQPHFASVVNFSRPDTSADYVPLLDLLLTYESFDEASKYLQKITRSTTRKLEPSTPALQAALLDLTRTATAQLRKHGINFIKHAPLKSFFRSLFLTHLLPGLGPKPIQHEPVYAAFPAFACKSCKMCPQISRFLTTASRAVLATKITTAEWMHLCAIRNQNPSRFDRLKVERDESGVLTVVKQDGTGGFPVRMTEFWRARRQVANAAEGLGDGFWTLFEKEMADRVRDAIHKDGNGWPRAVVEVEGSQ